VNALQQKADELTGARTQMTAVFAAKPDRDFTAEEVKGIQERNADLIRLQDEYNALKTITDIEETNRKGLADLDRIARPVPFAGGSERADDAAPPRGPRKSLGEAFIEGEGYKGWRPNSAGQVVSAEVPDLGFKTTFTTGVATLTGYDRQPSMVNLGTQQLTVADLLAQGQTNQNTIRYVKEDTFTNAATTVSEGSAKPEAAFDTSEVDAPVRKIAVTAKVTDELFADFPAMRDYVDNRLRYMVGLTEEAQLLVGDGTPPNIQGIETTSGILTQAKGTDSVPDAFFKAMVKIMTQGFFQPDGVVMHPLDWQDVRLLTTADGIYIWGPPSEAGASRLWGLPVVVTTSQTQNTGLVGAFKLGAQIFRRMGLTVEATNTNVDDFVKNLITIRVEERLALAVYRPKAFCTVTGV
jgi:HK97 family phage major capsid protein